MIVIKQQQHDEYENIHVQRGGQRNWCKFFAIKALKICEWRRISDPSRVGLSKWKVNLCVCVRIINLIMIRLELVEGTPCFGAS